MTNEFVLVTAILMCASFVRGALGFGEALVAMPLLAFLIPTTTAAPLVALCGTLTAIIILCYDWRHVALRPATLLTVFGLLAVPFGVALLKAGDERLVKGVLALVVTVFSVWSLWNPQRFKLRSDLFAPIFGFCAGFLGGAYNTAGPPLVIFGMLRHWSPQQFRATLQSYCLIAGLWVIVCHRMSGLLTDGIVSQFLISIPLIVASTLAGLRVTSRIPAERFIRIVLCTLIVVGFSLGLSCWNDRELVQKASEAMNVKSIGVQ
ncbi:MAG: sulfite exporter TauE/SafE family protein [Fuerstiella sp.]|nr:sulfite exporter TauE/SafE family protein [Fuerstiella sp.]